MCLDGGLGDVQSDEKNIWLLDGVGEKMTATFQANDTDVWLVTRKHFSNEFYSYLISGDGISPPIISVVGWDNPEGDTANAIGQMKISPNGKKLAFTLENQYPIISQLFDFDNLTGEVSNVIDLPVGPSGSFAYGVAFSGDNSKLYIKGAGNTGLIQFDLSSDDSATIVSSMTTINATNGNGAYAGTGLQLANNGKIYGVGTDGAIDVINNPNEAGDDCNYVTNAISSTTIYTFPGFIDSYKYKNGLTDCKVNSSGSIPTELEVSIYPVPVTDKLIILYKNDDSEQITLRLKNETGSELFYLKERGCSHFTRVIDVTELDAGIYFLEISSEDKNVVKKVVKW